MSKEGGNNYLKLLVPPAGFEPAAPGLGIIYTNE